MLEAYASPNHGWISGVEVQRIKYFRHDLNFQNAVTTYNSEEPYKLHHCSTKYSNNSGEFLSYMSERNIYSTNFPILSALRTNIYLPGSENISKPRTQI